MNWQLTTQLLLQYKIAMNQPHKEQTKPDTYATLNGLATIHLKIQTYKYCTPRHPLRQDRQLTSVMHIDNWLSLAKSRRINHLNTKRRPLYLTTQSVPRCKHHSLTL